jgi:hypothetical protein
MNLLPIESGKTAFAAPLVAPPQLSCLLKLFAPVRFPFLSGKPRGCLGRISPLATWSCIVSVVPMTSRVIHTRDPQ